MVQYSMSILTFGDVNMNKPFIAIEGPIGVGKSSLAHKLSQTLDFYEEKEIITENPFLSDFYEDISKWSFQTEMFFLCNRYKQFQDVTQLNQGVVSDYHIHNILTEDMIMPNMIIFLDADLDVLKSRIAKRNRSFEHQIEDEYLLKLKKDYREYYESLQSNGSNVVLIDTTSIDFLKNEQDYEDILHIILPMIGDITNE